MQEKFKSFFNQNTPYKSYFSPGRVNLIGEHIDYNGGLVFPAAINLGTYGIVGLREDMTFRFVSLNFEDEGVIERSIDDLNFKVKDGWANYAKGILYTLKERGYTITHGFDLLVYGNLPTASGLSSSASLELLVTYIANDLYHLNISRIDMALLSQFVENNYMNMHCGIMDQLIIACGKKNKALLMNTATLEISEAVASFDGYQWIIMNTNYQRKTTDSKYNERRKECMDALSIIQNIKPITHLCELDLKTFESLTHHISDPTLVKRARHVVSEQERTLKAKAALDDNDALLFGKLLNESHESLKNDYEVTGIHLDTLVSAALEHGALGARVTGAGFGGCSIALVPDQFLEHFEMEVAKAYHKVTHLNASFYKVTFEDGVGEINL